VVGSSLTLKAGAEGTEPMTYQWFKHGVLLSGATGPTHLLLNLQSADSGIYHVTVANRAGLLSSDTAVSVVSADTLPLLAGPLTNQNNGNEYYLLNQSTWIEAEAWAQTLGGISRRCGILLNRNGSSPHLACGTVRRETSGSVCTILIR
jgi:hypothetical protein